MSATLTPSMSTVLSAAILAMDAYNRGYNPGIFNLPDASGTGLGDATIGIEDGDNDPIAKSDGFYAISYTIGSTLVISYRGTDNLNPFDSANDIINGWLSGISLPSNQSDLAATFYDSATGGGTLTSGVLPTVILVGHSLGGGLAGYIAALTGDTAFVFDSMPYGGLSILTYLAEASSQGADLISALTGDYATLPLPNGQSITAQSVSGEFLSAARPADPAIADGIGSAFYGDQAGTLISYDVAAVDGSANSPGPLNAYQDTSILNLPAAVELHSASLLVLLQYASDNNFQTWESIGAQLFQAYQNSAIAAAVGLGQGVTGNASVSSQLLTEIAYSAINDGAMPFGDTGIAALFHDADSLGQFFSFTSTPSTFVTNVETDLTEVVVEYAGWLAKNVDTDSSNSSGIVTLVSQGFGLDVNLSSSAWAIDSAKYPDVVGLDDLLQNVFQQNTNYAGSIFQPNSGASPTGVTLQIGASSASLQGDSKADVFVVTGDGVTINSGSTSNDIVIAGNSATVNISPQSSDSPGTVSNTIELAGNNQTLNLNASTASSGVTIVIGQPGNNTFDIDNGFGNADDTFNNATNIIWGGGGTSTYNFLSNSYIAVYYLQDPTVQSVSDIDVAQLESLYGYGYTIIIDPTSSDRIEFRGNLLSSSSYQKIYENASANYDFKYYGYPAGIQSSDGNQFYYEEHFGNEGDYLEVKDSTSFQYVPDGNIQFLDISHFINGDFGITLFGDGPDETENGSSSGYPNATDSGFFSYNQKHYVSTTGLQDYADSSGSGPNDNFDFGQGEGQLDIR